MKIQLASLTLAIALTGCATVEQIAGDALGEAVGNAVSGTVKNTAQSQGYSVEKEYIAAVTPERTSRDYGEIKVTKTSKNPKGQTMVRIDSCSHPRIGEVDCSGYLYELTPEGWIIEDWINIDRYQSSGDAITVAAGDYYLKLESEDTGKDYYTTGELTLQSGLTNHVTLVME